MSVPSLTSSGGLDWAQRLPRRAERMMIPRPLADDPGLVLVDATWGKIQPHELAAGVRTIGELELIAHARAGLPMIDSRRVEQFAQATIPGARSLPHGDLPARIDELDPRRPAVLFCNGPQCAATPSAVNTLLDQGYPGNALLYYRGGLHDWITLGLPTVGGEQQDSQQPKEMPCTT
jgi:rhodanese-related sulfurtransferase